MPSLCARAASRYPAPAAAEVHEQRLPPLQAARLALALSAAGWTLIVAVALWAFG